MTKRKPQSLDPEAIARRLEKRGVHMRVEEVEAELAKFRAAMEDDAAMVALLDDRAKKRQRLAFTAALIGAAAQNPRVQKKKRVAAVKREHAALADQLRRSGEPKPSAQAWEELAKRHGRSPEALKRWANRNR